MNELDNTNVEISEDVIATIAGKTALEIEGVYEMNGGIVGEIKDIVGKKSLKRGVKVEITDTKDIIVDLFLTVKYGVKIPDIAWEVQENVKKAVESMSGLVVTKINIHVVGVEFESNQTAEDDTEKEN